MGASIIEHKSFEFAVRIVKLCRHLRLECHEYDLSGQLIRAGTSIGANVAEALSGQSRRDFVSKLSIAAKETRETRYWLRLIQEAEILSSVRLAPLLSEVEEILKILNSIILTCRDPETKPGRS